MTNAERAVKRLNDWHREIKACLEALEAEERRERAKARRKMFFVVEGGKDV